MKKQFLYWLTLCLVVVIGCKKEESFELGNEPAAGSLQSDITGDCLPKTVNGVYEATKPLVPTVNTITIQVNVTKTGTYLITTDTVNGYYFRATGTFTTLGPTNVILRGNGTPFVQGTDNFVVSYDGTICDIAVDVLPSGAGGPATFTLVNGGTPPNCASAVVSGTYVKDVAVNATNYVDITVNVTQIGTYSITATGGGMTFSKTSAAFTSTGNQTIRLTATGTPTTVGANTITFAAPFASCSFTVTVSGQAAYTIDCPNVVVNGTYQVGVALTAANTIVIPVTAVTTPGAYSITVTAHGMTFSGSGNLTTAPTTITLQGVGAPAASASPTFTIILPAPLSCTTPPKACAGAPSIDWAFDIAGGGHFQGTTYPAPDQPELDATSLPPYTALYYGGDDGAGGDISFTLVDVAGGILAGEQYNATANPTIANACAFYFTNATIDLASQPAIPPDPQIGTIKFTITSHNVATKTIIGTFSGIAVDQNTSTNKTIQNGTFKAVYQ